MGNRHPNKSGRQPGDLSRPFADELRIGFDLTGTLRQMLLVTTKSLGVDAGSVLVLDEAGRPLRWFDQQGGDVGQAELDAAWALLKEGMIGWVVREGRGDIVDDLATDPRWLKLPDLAFSLEKGSAICVPLLLAGRVVGVLSLFHPDPGFFQPQHLSLLQNYADQAAMAVENARLYAAVRRWAEDMTALYETTLNIAADQPLNRLLNTIIAQAMDLLHCQGGALFLWRDQENVLELVATYDAELDLEGLRIAADKGLAGHVFQTGEPLVINEQEWATDSQNQLLNFAGVPATSALAVPLIWHGRRVGVLIAFERRPDYRFDHTARRLATLLGNQAAAAIVSAELHAQTTRRLQELSFLNETTLAITSTLDLDQILNTLTSKVKDLLGVEACSIALVEQETGDLIFKVASGGGAQTVIGQRVPVGQGIVGAAAQTARPVNVPDVWTDERFFADFDQEQDSFVSRSILAVPMISRGQVVGVVEGLNKPGGFDHEDERLLSALANLAASIVDNAALFERVQAAESRFQSLFEDAADAVWVTDVDGVIVQANRKAERLTGQVPDRLADLVDPEEADKLAQTLDLAAQGGEVTIEAWISGEADHSIPLELRVKRIDVAGQVHVQWMGRDISDRRELEQLREDLTHMLIHDLKSPLGTVINSLNMLQDLERGDQEDYAGQIIDIALRATSRMSHMIGSLLDIGRLEAGQPLTNLGPVPIEQVIRSAVELVTPLAQYKRVRLNLDLTEPLPVLQGDANMLERVIVNLLDNGLKFTPSGGEVGLWARVERVNGAQSLCVGVRDNGPGIPPSAQSRIFDKFARAQNIPQADGVGLGLSFCRLAVEAHGGRIWVDSQPGEGATFTFMLPLPESEWVGQAP